MTQSGGPTLGDWAALVAAASALLSLIAALLAWRAPRGAGPPVGWDAQYLRGAPTGEMRESPILGVTNAMRDPDLVVVRNVGWRPAFNVVVQPGKAQVTCDRLDPNSGMTVQPWDEIVAVTWSTSPRWPRSRRRRLWRSPPLT